jgi:hypothetical protein
LFVPRSRLSVPDSRFFPSPTRFYATNNLNCPPQNPVKAADSSNFGSFYPQNPHLASFGPVRHPFPADEPLGNTTNSKNKKMN